MAEDAAAIIKRLRAPSDRMKAVVVANWGRRTWDEYQRLVDVFEEELLAERPATRLKQHEAEVLAIVNATADKYWPNDLPRPTFKVSGEANRMVDGFAVQATAVQADWGHVRHAVASRKHLTEADRHMFASDSLTVLARWYRTARPACVVCGGRGCGH